MKRLACLAAIATLAIAPTADAKRSDLPPHWRTWIKVAQCEMPIAAVPGYQGNRWKGIAWNQTRNSSYNAIGMTRLNWETFRRPSQRNVDLHAATPLEQLWSAERLWAWANAEYPGNGWSAWECSEMIGWTTADPKDALK